MIENEILDTPESNSTFWSEQKASLIATLILFAFIFITRLAIFYWLNILQKNEVPFIFHLSVFFGIILSLYFFVKKINYQEISIGRLFLWSVSIVFVGHFFNNIIEYIYYGENLYASPKKFLIFHLGVLLRSVILGNLFSIGVLQLVKKNNWAMLLLMFFMAMVFISFLELDRYF